MAAARGVYAALPPYRKVKDAGTTLDSFNKYVKRALMVFDTEDIDEDKKKKALLQLWGGERESDSTGHFRPSRGKSTRCN